MSICLELAPPCFRKAPHCHFPFSSDTRSGAVARTCVLGVQCRHTGRPRTDGSAAQMSVPKWWPPPPASDAEPWAAPWPPRQSSGKEPICQGRRCKRRGSIPGSGRSPGGRQSNPLQYSCLENSLDREAWQATVHRVAKSQTGLKQLSTGCSPSFSGSHLTYSFLMICSSLHVQTPQLEL